MKQTGMEGEVKNCVFIYELVMDNCYSSDLKSKHDNYMYIHVFMSNIKKSAQNTCIQGQAQNNYFYLK
jgi:hypothetical protein